jgi:hypothetical protein
MLERCFELGTWNLELGALSFELGALSLLLEPGRSSKLITTPEVPPVSDSKFKAQSSKFKAQKSKHKIDH